MDLKNPSTQKWLLAVLVGCMTVYFWYTKMYTPSQEEIEMNYTRLESLETELKNVEMKFHSLEALKAEYNELTSRYQRISQLLPEEEQLASLLSKIHGAALETSSRVATVDPQAPVSEGFYDRQSYKLSLHSTYHDLGDFLARLSNLPFIVNVSDVTMNMVNDRDNPEAANGGFSVTTDLTVSSYRVKESEKLVLIDQPSIAQSPKEPTL